MMNEGERRDLPTAFQLAPCRAKLHGNAHQGDVHGKYLGHKHRRRLSRKVTSTKGVQKAVSYRFSECTTQW